MKIIEDVLPVEQSDWLEDILKSPELQWSYIPDSSGSVPDGERQFPSFSHPVLNTADRNPITDKDMFFRLECVNHSVAKKAGLNLWNMNRVRLGMHIPDPTWTSHHGPHTDQRPRHDVVLYYVNNSDGDTYFFDDDEQVIDRITPKKNTMVVFDGHTVHASSYPTKGQRITINFNYSKGKR